MRIAALILGILGALSCAFLGMKWLSDYNSYKDVFDTASALGMDTAEVDGIRNAAYVLLVAAGVGLVGSFVAFFRGMGKIIGSLMVVLGVAPAIFDSSALVFSSILILAGILTFFVKDRAPEAMPVSMGNP